MLRFLIASAAALAVASCATAPYGDPYGQPYPPSGQPYPGQPYPPTSPYPPQPGYPPAPGADCPIAGSRDWTAFVNRMPGPDARPQLVVSGIVRTPTAGYRLAFDPHLILRESHPAHAVAVLRAFPPTGAAPPAIETHEVRWQWPLTQQIGSVEIVCGSQTLARISPVREAY